MEQSIHKLTSFLNEIFKAQTAADELRGKLSSSSSIPQRIFEEIDKENKGKITSVDIREFCQSQGSTIGEMAVETISRYFQNWNRGISESEFSMALKPKSLLHQLSTIKENEELIAFVNLIDKVVTSFNNLETLRIEFSENWEDIVSYFMTDYDCDQDLTRESLREFMLENKIYSRTKFALISGYIFGVNQQSIPWESFFNINQNNKIKIIETSSRMLPERSVDKLKEKETETERNEKNNEKKICKKEESKQENQHIHNVLFQVQEIQKNINQNKFKTQTSVQQMLPPDSLNSKTPTQSTIEVKHQNDQQTKSCFEKSVSNVKKTVRMEELDLNMGETEWRKGCFDIGKDTKRMKDFENSVYEPVFCPQESSYNYSIGADKRSLIRGELMRTSSEAQLKINEIERRAMDKFFNSRRACHLPNDHHIPYFYQNTGLNMEMTTRMRTACKTEGISNFASPTSRISKLLNTKIDRAVSPNYFRS